MTATVQVDLELTPVPVIEVRRCKSCVHYGWGPEGDVFDTICESRDCNAPACSYYRPQSLLGMDVFPLRVLRELQNGRTDGAVQLITDHFARGGRDIDDSMRLFELHERDLNAKEIGL